MAFEQDYKDVFNQFASIDSKITKDDERTDYSTQRDLMELQVGSN